jgi:phosphocarrier protein HPr
MVELTAIVQNSAGIHCRPSAVIIKEAMNYPGDILVSSDTHESDLRSVMSLLALGLHQGADLTIRVSGPDEANFCRKLVTLFETHFDFPPRAEGDQPAVSAQSLDSSVIPPQTPV